MPQVNKPIYKRILLKLSGEVLKDENDGISPSIVSHIATKIKQLVDLNVEVALVVGGGNIFRGLSASRKGMDRTTADYMGMLATVINALALQDGLEAAGVPTRVQTSISMRQVAEPYIRRRATSHLSRGRVVIFAAGTGSPYFSTDTTAALRSNEVDAEVLLKATKVDGIYNADPATNPDAVKYEQLSYMDALQKRLQVMDATAFSLCMDNNMPIIVFNFHEEGSLMKVVTGDLSAATKVC